MTTCLCDKFYPDTPLGPQNFEGQDQTHRNLEPFTYTDLDTSQGEIRLIRIKPRTTHPEDPRILPTNIEVEIFHASLTSKPVYNALSYAWGEQNGPQYRVLLNGHDFLVGRNLFTALREFSSWSKGIVIWIDAICINQSDMVERNHQVNQMKRIYSQAVEVSVWLGPHYDESNRAFWIIRDFMTFLGTQYPTLLMCEYLEDMEPVEDPEVPRGLRAFAKLLLRDYWRRMWVVQELTVASKINIHVGSLSAAAQTINKVQELLRDLPSGKLSKCLQHDEYVRNALVLHGMLDIMEWKRALAKGEMTFHDCLRWHQHRKSSNPRDRLYALAAISDGKSKLNIEIDYAAPVRKVYIDFARAEIETSGKLDMITSVLRGDGTNPHNLPSWVADWSDESLELHVFFGCVKDNFFAAGSTVADFSFSGDGNVLRIKAITLGTIAHLGRTTDMPEAIGQITGSRAIYSWWLLHQEHCKLDDHLPCVDEFIRTINCELYRPIPFLPNSPRVYEAAFADLLTLFMNYRTEYYHPKPAPPLDASILEIRRRIYDMREAELNGKEIPVTCNEKLPNEELAPRLLTFFMHLWDRRFFLFGDGTMGMAPLLARKGDVVCVPFGCPHPMVLRREGEAWVVVGEAYVEVFMYGKAVEMWEAGELACEEFELQ